MYTLPTEEQMLARMPGVFEFMGWKFGDRPHGQQGLLSCFKPLLNPFPKDAYWSYCTYELLGLGDVPLGPRRDTLQSFVKKRAAAWLIAHWYEHALVVCPCQQEAEEDKPSNFREAVISGLIWWDHIDWEEERERIHEMHHVYRVRVS